MLTAEQVAAFERDGFVNGGQVLTDAEVDELRDELTRVMANGPDHDGPRPALMSNLSGDVANPVVQIVNIWQASEPFERLLHRPKIVEEIAQLTGASALRVWHDQIQYKPAEKGGVNMWHQDAPLWPVLAPMTEVSAWVALDDVDADNGCMSMVPGSHRWGDRIRDLFALPSFEDMPATWEGHDVEVRLCPVRRGEVHYHHALTWHGSHANRSGRPRRAIAVHYMTQDTRFVAGGAHPLKHLIEVADGELITGDAFPVVYRAGASVG
jgi:ectoine hydroxylase-related dioxygenase (phytanoyl-CoA dioxygenase family)